MEEYEDDDIYGDEEIEGEPEPGREEDEWIENDPFFDDGSGFTWEDNSGNLHELYTGDLPEEAELRASEFSTPEEAEAYIDKILTDVDQFFEIVYDEDKGYSVYYLGGSE